MRFFSQQLLLIILLSIGTTSLVHANMTYVEQDYGDDYRQGLAYINHKAKEFIAEYNQKHNTNWHTLEPNAKVFVPTCTVPLKARWSKIALNLNKDKYVVSVYCDKSVEHSYKKWHVNVPVFNEKGNSILDIE
ncbi:hypothetical protein [Gilliamella sp. Choc5-1]|uniref:hypothetical protein n=1 Tax=Gilliamella sp. Choc5-1 TaxID=3120238 RepID=UPI001146FEFD|nr:hypothetical protein [Gilliamella apicola]